VTVAILAATAGAWLGIGTLWGPAAPGGPEPVLRAGTLLPSPKPLADFALTKQDGEPLTRDGLRGHWTFLAFGFVSCPHVCPTTLATLDALDLKLSASGGGQAQYLFVSVDPEHDSPELVGEFVRNINPQFRGATGSHAELRALTRQLGIIYQAAPEHERAVGNLLDHSAAILLIDPEVRLAAIFSTPQDATAMAADFVAISAPR
jgi:protein SCO1/2